MNLADMLVYADIQQLSKIADNYDCQCDGHSKNELIQSILSRIARKEVFEQQVHGLSAEDVRFINSLLFDKRDSFSLEELIARAQQTKFVKNEQEPWNPRDIISRFKQRGWLFNGFSPQTKYLFQVPQDLKRRFIDVLANHFMQQLQRIEEPEIYRDEQKLILDDIYQFLRFAYHQEVALTADGTMHKRHLQQLLNGLSVPEDASLKEVWRFGYGRRFKEYPNRFSFIYDYCFFHQYIDEQQGRLTISEQGKERVLTGQREDISQVYRFWLKLYKGPIYNLQSIVMWLERLARHWVTVQSLERVLCPLIKPFYYDTSEAIFEQRILQMLMHLGLVRIGEDRERGKVAMISKLGGSVIRGTVVQDEEKIEL